MALLRPGTWRRVRVNRRSRDVTCRSLSRPMATASRQCRLINILMIWDMATGACKQTLNGHSDEINEIAISPNGGLARVRVTRWYRYDLGRGDRRPASRRLGAIVIVSARSPSSPNGDWLASGSYDHTVRIWEAATGACTQAFNTGNADRHLAWDASKSRLHTETGILNHYLNRNSIQSCALINCQRLKKPNTKAMGLILVGNG